MHAYKLVFSFLALIILQCKNVQGGNEVSLAQIITTIFGDNDILKNITVPHLDFATGEQEFGWFKGYFENMKIYGLDAYKITKFEFTLKQQQVNISVPQINFTGYYDLDGMLNFPIANKPIHMFGKGDMKTVREKLLNKRVIYITCFLCELQETLPGNTVLRNKLLFIAYSPTGCQVLFLYIYQVDKIVIRNLTTSVILRLKSKGGKIQVDKLLISVKIGSTNVKLSNLMGGGDLEDIFNEYLSVLGPTLFDHYKNDIIEDLKGPLVHEINKFLDSFFETVILGVAENVLHLKINKS